MTFLIVCILKKITSHDFSEIRGQDYDQLKTLNIDLTSADVPARFAAIISDKLEAADNLVEHPHFPLKEEANFLQHDCFVLSTGTDKEQEIDVKELTGAACVFHGKHAGVRNHGWSC